MNRHTIPAAIGFGGAAICIFVAIASGMWTRYAPAVREFIHWLLVPQFIIGLFVAMVMMGLGVIAMHIDEARYDH